MPAKSPKKTPTRSTSNVTKKSILGRSFNLRSRKVQFVITILVIAVLGGGYFTFKSFAADLTYSFSPKQLSGYFPTNARSSKCYTNLTTDSSKNSIDVLSATCDYPAANYSVGTPYVTYAKGSRNGNWRACFGLKGSATGVQQELYVYPSKSGVITGSGKATYSAKHEVNTTSYVAECTPWTFTTVDSTESERRLTASLHFEKGLLLLSSATIEFQGPATTSPPTPTK